MRVDQTVLQDQKYNLIRLLRLRLRGFFVSPLPFAAVETATQPIRRRDPSNFSNSPEPHILYQNTANIKLI